MSKTGGPRGPNTSQRRPKTPTGFGKHSKDVHAHAKGVSWTFEGRSRTCIAPCTSFHRLPSPSKRVPMGSSIELGACRREGNNRSIHQRCSVASKMVPRAAGVFRSGRGLGGPMRMVLVDVLSPASFKTQFSESGADLVKAYRHASRCITGTSGVHCWDRILTCMTKSMSCSQQGARPSCMTDASNLCSLG